MDYPKNSQNDSLLRFATSDGDEFADRMASIAPGLSSSPFRAREMRIEISGTKLPDLGLFASTLVSFHVQSPVRPFYGLTIPLGGQSKFLVANQMESIHRSKAHLQHPDRPFEAFMPEAPFTSLQLCFDRAALDTFATRMKGGAPGRGSLMETLDYARPDVQSFARHATFVWSEVCRGGPIVAIPLVAKESVLLLSALLIAAADPDSPDRISGRADPARMRQAEEYIMANLFNPISIADVAMAARTSARTLSREFRRQRGTTIKGFINQRRLESANRTLLAAEPGSTNVTQVALDLGLDQLGRFSAAYKKAFGELPSATLAR